MSIVEGARPTTGLDWALGLLFDTDPGHVAVTVRSRKQQPPAGFTVAESYLAVPKASNPKLLVPLGSAKAAAAATARNHDATSPKARLAKQALGAALRTGVAQRLLPDRIDVSVRGAARLLTGELEDCFGRRPLHMAVLLGPPRLNRKPVLQLLGDDGEVVGYVKAAWNDLTRALVDNEAAVLRRLGSERSDAFIAPEVVHHGPWGPLTLLATTALPNTVKVSEARVFDPPMDVIAAIAATGPRYESPLGASAYWADVRRRLAAHPAADGILSAVVDHVEARSGDAALAFGAWHGDFTPWNMARTPGGIYVWDWERSAPAPLGLDLLHFLFQTVCRFDGRKPAESVEICRERTPEPLAQLGLPPGSDEALWNVYRMELLFRYEEARETGVLAKHSRIHGGMIAMFEGEMER